MIPLPLRDLTIAHGYKEMSRVIHRCSRRRPDASLSRRWHLIRDQITLPIRPYPDDAAMIVAAVPETSTEGDIDHPLIERERPPLLMSQGVHTGRIDRAAYLHLACVQIKPHQDMGNSGYFSHGEDEMAGRIVHRRAGNAAWIDIATGES